jgi:DNA-binding MarR family transcriptional regulator
MASCTGDELAGKLQNFGLQRDHMKGALARRAGVTESDLDALEHLEAGGPLTQRDLGERLALSSGAVTMLVDRLERAGWVHRRPHPTDRRFILIELSGDAQGRAPEGLDVFHTAIGALVDRVPPAQRAIIGRFLDSASEAAARAARDMVAEDPS